MLDLGDRHSVIDRFLEHLDLVLNSGAMPTTIQLPLLPAGIADILSLLVEEGLDERMVITIFLNHLASSAAGVKLSRQAKRLINKAYKELKVYRDVARLVEERLQTGMGVIGFPDNEYDIPTFLRNGADPRLPFLKD